MFEIDSTPKIMNQQMINAFHLHDEGKENKYAAWAGIKLNFPNQFYWPISVLISPYFYKSFQMKTFCFDFQMVENSLNKIKLKNYFGLCLFAFHFWLK